MDPQEQNGALLIAASIIAVIRLRGVPIKPSPKLSAVVADSIGKIHHAADRKARHLAVIPAVPRCGLLASIATERMSVESGFSIGAGH